MRYVLPVTLGLFVVSALPALAYTYSQADADACTGDAMRLCGQAIPDQQRIIQCLYQKRKQLTPACYAVYERHSHAQHPATFSAKR
jgi:type II secretory pathway component PulL